MEDNRTLRKWLLRLLIVHIIGLTYSVLTHTVNFGIFNEWLKLAISTGFLFCLSRMVKYRGFYRLPVAFLAMKVICTLARLVLSSNAVQPLVRDLLDENYIEVLTAVSGWVVWILWICDIGAMLFEWIAHGKVVKPADQQLSKYWQWLTVAALVVSAGMFLLNVFVPDMLRLGTLDVALYQKMFPLLNLPGVLIRILYMVCLYKSGQVLVQAKDPTG